MKWERAIAAHVDVQDDLGRRAFAMKATGDRILQETPSAKQRAAGLTTEGHSEIRVEMGDETDWYVVLSDDRGDKAAAAIEYGRAGYIDPDTGERYGGTEGLNVLHRATGGKLAKRGKVKLPVTRKRRKRRGWFVT
ncbi:hypothetical protein FHR83_007103 [Actinoplanes campanulatus]|uniref:Uncharacterized protein n=2 Tax=Actinoplanes campanulatus TaxID=113559 RepID=A0A7W5ANQ9_9ACTN|nr:hypothetical protein [Actinoplanes campanulatus]MBB3099397.1 hypothetical protein [Actinoplanes campanulatus]